MKRKTKNIICCIALIILIGLTGLTIYFAKNNTSSDNSAMSMQMGDNTQMGSAPGMANDNGQNNSSSDMQEPPEKPDGESESDSSSTSDSESNSQNGNGDMEEPPEKPDGESSGSSDMQMPTNMGNETSSSIGVVYYILFGVEALLLSLIIVYLIQSKFNKKTFKETYSSSDKTIIGILLSIILTAALTFSASLIATKTSNSSETGSSTTQQQNTQSSSATYSAVSSITESTTISDEEYSSETADENALSVSGDIEVTASDITVEKTGDSDGGDNTSFYGTNSAIIAKDGATLNLKNITVTTDATGANGVFSYGGSATTNNSSSDGTTINISDSTITTKKDNSGGIMTTGGGTTNATNLTITTAGTSSAAIRSDRGGGEVNVDGGTYKTTGQGSPTIYSTAEISVKDATLVATASEGIVIEGKNSVTIENTKLTDTNSKLNGQSTTYKNIFLYQSMSGDADDGESTFTATDSTIITNKGDSFYITNTTAKITLTNNTITNNDSTGNFLRAQADSWGTSGSNGGIVTLIMSKQEVEGNIVIDSVSTLDMTMTSSDYEGTINGDNEAKSIKLTLDKKSTIKLTGDSYITSLDNADSTNSNIDFNGYKLYVNGKAIN